MLLAILVPWGGHVLGQDSLGSIRGLVLDKDFDAPLPGARVLIVETNQETRTTDQGNYLLRDIPIGTYTLVFSKAGFVQQLRSNVVVQSGQLTDVNAALTGEFTEMEEFVVQDALQLGGGTEAALLQLRFESATLLDSISADLMSRAGASDAASALRLVSGATVKDGKSAVIRGLPDRYVSSQMNSVRLPTTDEDKRAVELDQFPATVIESIQVSKTFTPDQQGDASGGAVDVRLKGIPTENTIQFKTTLGYNTQVGGNDFLSYDGGGLNFWGRDDGGRDIQTGNLGRNWDGAVGTNEGDTPIDHKWSIAGGGVRELDNGWKVGGFASFFYERDSQFIDNGVEDEYWVVRPGEPMTPRTIQGTPEDGDFKTSLFDVTQGSQSVQWGGLATFGIENEHHAVNLSYLYTNTTEDKATLAVDTRGKEYYFPGYDPTDLTHPGNDKSNINAAPYIRAETLEYTERSTGTLQLNGRHEFVVDDPVEIGDFVSFGSPEFDWTLGDSFANLDQPDKRQFGALWRPDSLNPGAPPFTPPFVDPAVWLPFKPGANFTLGNLQRIYKEIEEDAFTYSGNLKFPFEQWSGVPGYLKFGLFDDDLERRFDQETFSNFGDAGGSFRGGFDEPWSERFRYEDHPITESLQDVDYDGTQEISAYYAMVDLPVTGNFNVIGGARIESTEIGVVNDPEEEAFWFPPGSSAPVELNPGDADVAFEQDDTLPSIGLVYEPIPEVTIRTSYSETIARQTFKELTPIIQQEFLGGPIFIGNPELGMSAVDNLDLRVDYRPYDGGLLSLSYFDKNIDDPIEYVQRVAPFTYTTPVNYPEGELSGFELEARQDIGHFWESLRGFSVGANATFIDSEVVLPDDEAAQFEEPGIEAPMPTRDMTNAPEHLYNFFLTYDLPDTGTQAGLFYTVQGDTLVEGAGQANGNFVPNVYAKEFDTLNFSLSQQLGRFFTVQFQAKNLTNALIEEVYRSDVIGQDVTRRSFTTGIEYSISIGARVSF